MTYLSFIRSYLAYRRMAKATVERFALRWSERRPRRKDDTGSSGFDQHYLYHTAWAARVLAQQHPEHHVDIGSNLMFVATVSAFVPVTFYDYRPADIHLDGLRTARANLLSLPFENGELASLSCMHVVEHVGLGRYGDPLDPDGDLKAAAELSRVLAPNGSLLFAAPVGKPRLLFNTHRIYSHAQILAMFPVLRLRHCALIPGRHAEGPIRMDAPPEQFDAQDYGCGCYCFTRPDTAGAC